MADVANIRAGINVDIVIDTDFVREQTDVRRASIYEVNGEEVILSQMEPPLTKHDLDREIIVTYTLYENGKPIREGFHAKVIEIIRDYHFRSLPNITAIIIKREGDPKNFDLRMHYRLTNPGSENGIDLIFEKERVHIRDISIGGALISHIKTRDLHPGEILPVTLKLDDRSFCIEAKIVRVWAPSDSKKNKTLEFVGLQFLNLDRSLNSLFGKKIFAIERDLVAKGMLDK